MTHILVVIGVILFAIAFAGVVWVRFIGKKASEDEETPPPQFPSVSGAGHMGAITPKGPKP